MACNQLIRIQIGRTWYESVTDVRISLGFGAAAKTATFTVFADSRPPVRSLVNIVIDGVKEFGGLVAKADPVQLFGRRKYQVQCVDFSIFAQKLHIGSYNTNGITFIDTVITQLINKGGASDEDWPVQNLAKVIRRPATQPPGYPIDLDPNLIQFDFENGKLGDAFNKLCERAGYRWEVDFGAWTDTGEVYDGTAGAVANAVFTRNDYGDSVSPVSVTVKAAGQRICADDMKWRNPRVTFTARTITRVIVARDALSLAIGEGIEPAQIIDPIQFGASSDEQFFRLLSKSNRIISAVIKRPSMADIELDLATFDPTKAVNDQVGTDTTLFVDTDNMGSWLRIPIKTLASGGGTLLITQEQPFAYGVAQADDLIAVFAANEGAGEGIYELVQIIPELENNEDAYRAALNLLATNTVEGINLSFVTNERVQVGELVPYIDTTDSQNATLQVQTVEISVVGGKIERSVNVASSVELSNRKLALQAFRFARLGGRRTLIKLGEAE